MPFGCPLVRSPCIVVTSSFVLSPVFIKHLLCARHSAGCQGKEQGVGIRCTCVQVLLQLPTSCENLDKLLPHIIVIVLTSETVEDGTAFKWQNPCHDLKRKLSDDNA